MPLLCTRDGVDWRISTPDLNPLPDVTARCQKIVEGNTTPFLTAVGGEIVVQQVVANSPEKLWSHGPTGSLGHAKVGPLFKKDLNLYE